jgi:hypothetical protein
MEWVGVLEEGCVGTVCEIHGIDGESANFGRDCPGIVAEVICESRWRVGVSRDAVTRTIKGTSGSLTCNYHNWREISDGGTTEENKRYSVGYSSWFPDHWKKVSNCVGCSIGRA